jgi:CheY-like chemotaxis protein
MVLVAEDVETNQKIVTEMSHLLNFNVEIAENGAIAIDKFESNSYALIFMDCQMPVMDGFAATQKIRMLEQQRGLTPTPIIALTAGTGREDKDRCKVAGMDAYLSKPFSISELSDSMRQLNVKTDGGGRQTRLSTPISKSSNLTKEGAFLYTTTDLDIFNFKAINNIREVEKQTGRALLPNILDGYISQMEEKILEMADIPNSGDTERLSSIAHAIKSMSANIGAEKVRFISADIEAAGRNGEILTVIESTHALSEAYKEFINEFRLKFIA